MVRPPWHAIVQDVQAGSSPAAWAVAWLPKGRRHLWLARYIGPGDAPGSEVWHVVDPSAVGCIVDLALTGTDYLGQNLARGHTVIRLPSEIDPGRVYFRGLMTCVAVAKYVCGLRWPLVFTPSGFIRRARREGFEVRP